MTLSEWLTERIAFANRQIEETHAEDRDSRLIWRGYRDAYRHVLENAPRWEGSLTDADVEMLTGYLTQKTWDAARAREEWAEAELSEAHGYGS